MAIESLRPRRHPHRIHGIHAGAKALLLRIRRPSPQTMTYFLSRLFRRMSYFLGTPISRLTSSAFRCSGGGSSPLLSFFLVSLFLSPLFPSPSSSSPPLLSF